MKKQELLKKATKCFIFNKEVAKLLPNKSMTRRVVGGNKVRAIHSIDNNKIEYTDKHCGIFTKNVEGFIKKYSPYKVGDIVWGREPARVVGMATTGLVNIVNAVFLDGTRGSFNGGKFLFAHELPKWITKCQAIPGGCVKEMARYFYRVTSVGVERLQDIPIDDIYKEGYISKYGEYLAVEDNEEYAYNKNYNEAFSWFKNLWNSTSKKDLNDWDSNPYVWVIEYEEIEYKNE